MVDFIKETGAVYDATPSYKLLSTMSYGTYTLETAVSDIVDNSITAQAHIIDLKFSWNENLENCYVEIKDDGYGMSSKELEKAMLFASKGITDERGENDLGKYGLGMKTASFFACKCLTVISKKDGYQITAKRLDQDFVMQSQRWQGSDLDNAEELKNIDLDNGTIVRWDKLTFVDNGINGKKYFLDKVNKISEHLGLFFHRFIESGQIKILINGAEVVPWNPTFLKNIGTARIEDRIITYKNNDIKLQSFLLPSTINCTEQEIMEMYRGDALKHQGFYIYRNDRLLKAGGWLESTKLTSHQQYNPVRIIVDVSSNMDSEFKVDFTKSSIKFPQELENQLINFAKTARSKASEAYKNRARIVHQPGVKKDEEVWHIAKNKNGVSFKISLNHPLIKMYTKGMDKDNLKKLIKLIENTIPQLNAKEEVVVKYTNEEIQNMLISFITNEIKKGRTLNEIKSDVYSIEPFMNYLEIVESYFEEVLRTNA